MRPEHTRPASTSASRAISRKASAQARKPSHAADREERLRQIEAAKSRPRGLPGPGIERSLPRRTGTSTSAASGMSTRRLRRRPPSSRGRFARDEAHHHQAAPWHRSARSSRRRRPQARRAAPARSDSMAAATSEGAHDAGASRRAPGRPSASLSAADAGPSRAAARPAYQPPRLLGAPRSRRRSSSSRSSGGARSACAPWLTCKRRI